MQASTQLAIRLDYRTKRSFLLFYSIGHEVKETERLIDREKERESVELKPEEELFSAKKEQRRYKEK